MKNKSQRRSQTGDFGVCGTLRDAWLKPLLSRCVRVGCRRDSVLLPCPRGEAVLLKLLMPPWRDFSGGSVG